MSDKLPPTTHIGRVRLRVADLDRSLRFYRDALGLRRVHDEGDDIAGTAGTLNADAALSASGRQPALVLLDERPGARSAPRGSTGLFHCALRVPGRLALARALQRIGESDWPLEGASDHAVSEALYLSDPDGNGIEVYADRPREAWSWRGGEIAMTTERLDLSALLHAAGDGTDAQAAAAGAEAPENAQAQAPDHAQADAPEHAKAEAREDLHPDSSASLALAPETTMGHIHLRVSDLHAVEAFYHDLLGFDVTVRSYPGALFLSAGGYHHHIGANIWQSRGGSAAPEDAAGLVDYAIVLPDAGARERLVERVRGGGVDVVATEEGGRIRDPDGNAVVLVS